MSPANVEKHRGRALRPLRRIRVLVACGWLLVIPALKGCSAAGSEVRGTPSRSNVALMEGLLGYVSATGDFQPLFDRLANDVVLKVTASDRTPASREFRGKRAVIAFMLNEGVAAGFQWEKPADYFGNGERVVILGPQEPEVEKRGGTVRDLEDAVIVDFRDGLITRYLIIQDASATAKTYRRLTTRASRPW